MYVRTHRTHKHTHTHTLDSSRSWLTRHFLRFTLDRSIHASEFTAPIYLVVKCCIRLFYSPFIFHACETTLCASPVKQCIGRKESNRIPSAIYAILQLRARFFSVVFYILPSLLFLLLHIFVIFLLVVASISQTILPFNFWTEHFSGRRYAMDEQINRRNERQKSMWTKETASETNVLLYFSNIVERKRKTIYSFCEKKKKWYEKFRKVNECWRVCRKECAFKWCYTVSWKVKTHARSKMKNHFRRVKSTTKLHLHIHKIDDTEEQPSEKKESVSLVLLIFFVISFGLLACKEANFINFIWSMLTSLNIDIEWNWARF